MVLSSRLLAHDPCAACCLDHSPAMYKWANMGEKHDFAALAILQGPLSVGGYIDRTNRVVTDLTASELYTYIKQPLLLSS